MWSSLPSSELAAGSRDSHPANGVSGDIRQVLEHIELELLIQLMWMLFKSTFGYSLLNILDLLLDTSETPRKPQYNMASELPLILRYCEFEDLNFICSSDARQALYEHLDSEFQTYMLQAAIFYEALSSLSIPEGPSEPCKKKKSHIPLMQRPTEPSYEERRARLKTKASNKSQPSEPHKQYTEAI